MPLILSALLACLAWSGDTPTISPGAAAPRDRVELIGVPVSGGRPRVWVRASEDMPARRAKRVSTADGVVRFRVPAVTQGVYDLLVRVPKTSETDSTGLLVIPDALRVQAPSDLELAVTDARPGDVLELTGHFLGSRRGRVEIASRRARVLSWEAGSAPGSAPGSDGPAQGRVRFRVPRRLGTGQHPITVTTAAGAGRLADAILITQSDHGVEPVFRADAGGLQLEAEAATVGYEVVPAPISAGGAAGGLVLLRAFDGAGKTGHWLSLSLRYDPAAQGPAELRGDDAIMQLVRIAPGDGQVWSSAYGWGGHVRVDILDNQDGLLSGTVSGWLEPVYGKAQALPISASFVAARN